MNQPQNLAVSRRRGQPQLKAAVAAVALALGGLVSPGASAASCTLTTNGDWGTPANWSCAVRPGTPNAADTATINVGGIVAISQAEQIASLTNAGTVNVNASLLAVLGGGVVNTGTINIGAAGRLDSRGSNAFTGTGTISMASGARFNLEGAATTSIGIGSTLSGAGTVGLQQAIGGAHVLSVLGVVSANSAGNTLVLQPTAGTSNAGVLEARNGGTLQLTTAVTQTGAGRIDALAGSVVLLSGTSISGGVVNTAGSGVLRVNASGSNLLSGLTVNGNVDLATVASAYTQVSNGLVLNGTLTIGASGRLDAVGTQILSGPGTLRLDAAGARFNLEGTNQTTIAANLTVSGQGTIGLQQLVGGSHVLVNNSTISANVSGGTLDLQPSGGTVNNNVLEARNGGTLNIRTGVSGAGQINALDTSVVQHLGSQITGNTIGTSGSGVFRPNSSGANLLNAVTVTGAIDMVTTANSRQRVANGLTLNGGVITIGNAGILSLDSVATTGANQAVTGTGSIVLADGTARLAQEGSGNTTIGANVVVRGQGLIGTAIITSGTNNLIVDGRISADVSGAVLTIARGASGGNSTVTNNGILEATGGGILRLSSDVTGTPGSQIRADAGSRVEQNGVTVAGIVNTSGSGAFVALSSSSNFLSGVTLNGTLDLTTIASSRERVIGGLVLNGAINVANGGILSIDNAANSGSQALSTTSTGTINLNDAGARLAIEGDGQTTLGANITVRGQGNIGLALITGGTNTLINSGTIVADVNGGTLNITPPANGAGSGLTNNGTLRATGGGILRLSTNVTANPGGQIVADTASSVVQNGVTITGVINTSGGGLLTAVSSSGNFLNGVTLNGTLDLGSIASSRERVINGLVLNGAINVANGGILSLDSFSTTGGNQTISGNGTINLNDSGARLSIDGDGQSSLGANIIVRGQGNIGTALNTGGTNTLINNGTIVADVNGGTLNITPPANGAGSGLTNNGTLRATGGGILQLTTNVTANPGSQIVADSGSSVVQNGVTITGVINTSGAGVLAAVSSGANILNGVTLNGTLDLASIVNSRERVSNGLVLNGAINIANGGILSLDSQSVANQTISGAGTINLNDAGARLSIEANGQTTLASTLTVRGQGSIGQAILVGGNNTLINNGAIVADVNGATLTIVAPANAGSVTNNGTLRATSGGTLQFSSVNIDNSGGTINAQDNGVVLHNFGTITGGTISSAGSGVFRVSSGGNFITGVTLTGVMDMATLANSRQRIFGGATINGSVNIANGGILSLDSSIAAANQTIGGTGSINLNDSGARLTIEGTGQTTLGTGLTVRGQGNIGTPIFVGGNNTLINNGTILADASGGTLTIVAPANGGSLAGTGTLSATGGGTLNLNTGSVSAQGRLAVGAAASTVNLNAQNLTLSLDYTNAQFGVGNSFNRRAGIVGTGQILASGAPVQTVTGNTISNGSTTTPTLTLTNVRVNAPTTFDFQVGNSGTGPALRGAVQTTANGGNFTDPKLSVTTTNFGPGTTQTVTLQQNTAGLITLLPSQRLAIVNNFDNTQSQNQVLNIVAGAGAAAFNVAAGSAGTPVAVANQRIGGSQTAAVTITNTAAAGAFTEVLNASFANPGANNNSAAITGGLGTGGVAAGAPGNTSMRIGVDSSSEGAKSTGQTINFQSNGTGTSGLGTIGVGSQSVTANGSVFKAAAGQLNTAALNFGVIQVGQSVSPVNLAFSNIASGAAGFVEDLKVTFGSITGPNAGFLSTNSGQLTGILAGQASTGANGTMTVSVSTLNAGVVNAAVGLNFITQGTVNGVSNGLGESGVGGTSFGVTGTINATVVNQAAPQINNPTINLAARVGDSLASTQRAVSVTNVAGAPPQAGLNASISTVNTPPITASGSFNGLNAGGTNNSSLLVGLNSTATAQNFTGSTASVALVSDATNQGCTVNCTVNQAAQNVTVNGKVYQAAVGAATNIDFGLRRVGDGGGSVSATTTVTNTAGVAALNDTLAASFTSTSGAPFSAQIGTPNTVAGLTAGGAGATLAANMSTATAGVFSGGTAGAGNLQYRSQNADMSDLVSGGALTLTGQVNNLAQAAFRQVSGAGSFTEETGSTFKLDFGNVTQGSGILTARLAAWNRAPGGAPSDSLKGSFSGATSSSLLSFSGFSAFGPSTGNPGVDAQQSTGDLIVSLLNTAPLGIFSQNVLLSGFSYNGILFDLPANATLVLAGNIVQGGGTTVIPLPPAAWLLLGGLGVFGWLGRRRQAAQA